MLMVKNTSAAYHASSQHHSCVFCVYAGRSQPGKWCVHLKKSLQVIVEQTCTDLTPMLENNCTKPPEVYNFKKC